MEWNMDDFWNEGGTTAFIERVSSALGIDASRIYTIQVWEGSVVVKFGVTSPGMTAE
jgi:hypothetical protein